MVMKDAIPLMCHSSWGVLFFKCEQHTIHDLRRLEIYNYTMMGYRATSICFIWMYLGSIARYFNFLTAYFSQILLKQLWGLKGDKSQGNLYNYMCLTRKHYFYMCVMMWSGIEPRTSHSQGRHSTTDRLFVNGHLRGQPNTILITSIHFNSLFPSM